MKDLKDASLTRYLCRFAPLVLILAAAAACTPTRRGGGPPPPVIHFTNESLDQATVYVVAPGRDFRRIGTVFAGQTATLTVPLEMTRRGPVNIVARMLARSDVPQTGPVSLYPGEQYQVRLLLNSRLMSFLPAAS
jgi:hypothetical protein